MSREQHDGAGRPRDENETDAVNEALASERLLAPAIEALVSTLDEEELTAGSWEALRGKLQVDAPTSEERATRPAAIGRANAPPTTRRARWHENARSKGHDGAAETPMLPPVSPRGGNATARWAVGLVLVAAVVVAGSWASLKAAEASALRDDQRILAYWMANPEMRLVALSTPAGAPGSVPARLGVVCVLPDGRALLLQPSTAPRGATYVVTGEGPAGTRELARGSGNMLQFDASGVRSVEIVLARGDDESEVIAQAELN